MTVNQSKAVSELLSTIDIEIVASEIEHIESIEELREYLEDNGAFDVEIVYYSRAMEYLSKNDDSLRESLELADEYGLTLKSLDSEKLASLLASRDMRDSFEGLVSDIDELFN
jgi:intracellular sulfur oxidation DsrE/DsrF family protein